MSEVNGSEEFQVTFILGPWLIGSCFELVLMGVLSCQFVNYYTWYPDDKRGLRIAAAILCLLSVLKSAESFAALWIFFIHHWGDIESDIMLSATGWWDTANPLMVALINFYVQCYFCHRLLSFSKRWYVVAPIFSLFVFALLSIVLGTYYIATLQEDRVTDWFAAHLSSVFAGDFILSCTTAYFLVKTKKNVLPGTAGLINSLVRLTFQTAAPAGLFTLFTLIFSQLHRSNNAYLGYTEIAFNQPLPKLYAISMMYTLNARRTIYASHRGRNGLSNSSDAPSGSRTPRPARRPNGDVELGQIQVYTQTEMSRQVDVRDMFRADTNEDQKHTISSPD
ncbi:hypothetical protein C8R44DRAFT_858278 [Mycena epipterygia]|nr:hypothetical protein C8R44DRAFT_858278 [Mycena epipterygia]